MRSNIIPFQCKQVAPTIYPLIGLFVHVLPTARTLMVSSPPPSPLLARDSLPRKRLLPRARERLLERDFTKETPHSRLRARDCARESPRERLLAYEDTQRERLLVQACLGVDSRSSPPPPPPPFVFLPTKTPDCPKYSQNKLFIRTDTVVRLPMPSMLKR